MVLVAAASLAMLRMLVTVFARPDGPARAGILVLFAVYLFGPLSAGAVAWLSVALRVLPLQFAMFMAIDAHVRYVRRGRPWALAAAAVWLALGMASADQGALVPVLLFALTVAYFVPGRLRDAARRAAAGYWRAWVLYGALLAAYCVIFFIQLAGSGLPVQGPGQASSLYRFAGTLFGTAALPGFLGGPWQWLASGYAQAAPPATLEFLSWVLAALVVAASFFFRPNAWRAWAILLGWIVAAGVLPAAIRGFGLSVTVLGGQTGYWRSCRPERPRSPGKPGRKRRGPRARSPCSPAAASRRVRSRRCRRSNPPPWRPARGPTWTPRGPRSRTPRAAPWWWTVPRRPRSWIPPSSPARRIPPGSSARWRAGSTGPAGPSPSLR